MTAGEVSLHPINSSHIDESIEEEVIKEEITPTHPQLYFNYLSGLRADLFKALIEAKILGPDGFFTKEAKEKATLISFTPKEIQLIKAHLEESIEFEGEKFTILMMLKELRAPTKTELIFQDSYLAGSDVLFIIFHLCPGYLERFFQSMGIPKLLPLARQIVKQHPFIASDGDIRIIVKRKDKTPLRKNEFRQLALTSLKAIPKRMRNKFLREGFERFVPLDKGFISFFMIHPKNSFFEIILLNNWIRDNLFSQDALAIPLQPILESSGDKGITPTNHEKSGALPLFDALLGNIRTNSLNEIDMTAYPRYLREITRGKSSCVENQEAYFSNQIVRSILRREGGEKRFIQMLHDRVKSHPSADRPIYFFFYFVNALINFQGSLDESTIQAITNKGNCLKQLEKSDPKIAQIASLLFTHKIPPKQVIATLSLLLLLDFTKELKNFTIEVGNHEGKIPVLKVAFQDKQEPLYLQIPCAFDEAIATLLDGDLGCEKELLKFLSSLIPMMNLGNGKKTLPILPKTYSNLLRGRSPFHRVLGFHLLTTFSWDRNNLKYALMGCIIDLWTAYSDIQSRKLLLGYATSALGCKKGDLNHLLKRSNFEAYWILSLLKYNKGFAAYNQLKQIRCDKQKKVVLKLLRPHILGKEFPKNHKSKIATLLLKWIEEGSYKVDEKILTGLIDLLVISGRREKGRELLLAYEKEGKIENSYLCYIKSWMHLLEQEFLHEELSLDELLLQAQDKFRGAPRYLQADIEKFLSPYLDKLTDESPLLIKSLLQSDYLNPTRQLTLRKKLIHRLIKEQKFHQAEKSFIEITRVYPKEDFSSLFTRLFNSMTKAKQHALARKMLLNGICKSPLLVVHSTLVLLEQKKKDEELLILLLTQIPKIAQDTSIPTERIISQITKLGFNHSLSSRMKKGIEEALLPIIWRLENRSSTKGSRAFIRWLYLNNFYHKELLFQKFWLKETQACISTNLFHANSYLDFARAKKMHEDEELRPLFIQITLLLLENHLAQDKTNLPFAFFAYLELFASLKIPSDLKKRAAKAGLKSLVHLLKAEHYPSLFQISDFILVCDPSIESKAIDEILTLALVTLIQSEKYDHVVSLMTSSSFYKLKSEDARHLAPEFRPLITYLFDKGFQHIHTLKKSSETDLAYSLMIAFPTLFTLPDWDNLIRLLTVYDRSKIWPLWKRLQKTDIFLKKEKECLRLWTVVLEYLGKARMTILPSLLTDSNFLSLLEGNTTEHICLEIFFLAKILEIIPKVSSKKRQALLTKAEDRFKKLKSKVTYSHDPLDLLEFNLIKALLEAPGRVACKRGEAMLETFLLKPHDPTVFSQYGLIMNLLAKKKRPYSLLSEMIDVIEITTLPGLQLDLVVPYILSINKPKAVLSAWQLIVHSMDTVKPSELATFFKLIKETYLALFNSKIVTKDQLEAFFYKTTFYLGSFDKKESPIERDFQLITFLQKSRTLDCKNVNITAKYIQQAIEVLANHFDNSPLYQHVIQEIVSLSLKLSALEPDIGATFLDACWNFWVELTEDEHALEAKFLFIREILKRDLSNHCNAESAIDQCIILCYYVCVISPKNRKKLNALLPDFKKTIKKSGTLKNKANFKALEERVKKNRNGNTLLSESIGLSNQILLTPKDINKQSIYKVIENIASAEEKFEAFSHAHLIYIYLYIFKLLSQSKSHVVPLHFSSVEKLMGATLKNPPRVLMPYLRSQLFKSIADQYEHKSLEENIKNPRSLTFLLMQVYVLGQSIDKDVYKDYPKIYFFHTYKIFDYLVRGVQIGQISSTKSGIPYIINRIAPLLNNYTGETRRELEDYKKTLLLLWQKKLSLPFTVKLEQARFEAILNEFEKPYYINRYLHKHL